VKYLKCWSFEVFAAVWLRVPFVWEMTLPHWVIRHRCFLDTSVSD